MEPNETVAEFLKSIAKQQYIVESADYGVHKKAVAEATDDATAHLHKVLEMSTTVDSTIHKTNNHEERQAVESDFSTLEASVRRQLRCLETLTDIVQIEDLFEPFWKGFAEKSTSLVKTRINKKETEPPATGNWTINTSQNCVEATRSVWNGITKMLKCTQVHVEHAANYHQFFADAEEFSQWMSKDLSKAEELLLPVRFKELGNDTQRDVKRLVFEIKTAVALYLRWRDKTNALWLRSQTIIPVPLRLRKPDFELPVVSLASYKTKDISVFEGEELTLVDNREKDLWKVRNLKGDLYSLPSTFVLIPGADADAINAAIRLRLQFLFHWTTMIKRAGKTIIHFLLKVIRDWTNDEETMLESLGDDGKREVLRMLALVASVFSPHWDSYSTYEMLNTKAKSLKTLLEKDSGSRTRDSSVSGQGSLVVIQTEPLVDLLNWFKDFWQYWEQMKIAAETSRHPEYLLTVQDADQYKFFSASDLRGKWSKSLLDFDEDDLANSEELEGPVTQQHLSNLGLEAGEGGGRGGGREGIGGTGEGNKDGEGIGGRGGRGGIGGIGEEDENAEGHEGRGGRGGRGGIGGTGEEDEDAEGTGKRGGRGGRGGIGGTGEEDEDAEGKGGNDGRGEIGGIGEGDENAEGAGGRGGRGGRGGIGGTGEEDGDGECKEWMETNGYAEGELCTIATARERAEASQLLTSEQEERQTFIITSVTDPRSGGEISMDDAVSLGIINQSEGKYVNPQTGQAIPIPAAMTEGKIKVALTKTKKSQEKKSDTGLITIKKYQEVRPFTVRGAIDAKTEKELTVDAATKAGILDLKKGVYKNLNTLEELTLGDALDSGLLHVDFDENAEVETSAEVVSKTYAVHAVVDTKRSRRLSFTEAVSAGLINTDAGTYLNRSTGKTTPIGDAIRQGFIKASVVKDPALLQVSRDNIITLTDATIQRVRRKIVQPLMAIYALKKAAADAAAADASRK